MKMTREEFQEFDHQVDDAVDYILRRYRREVAAIFMTMCESPIEVLLGATLYIHANTGAGFEDLGLSPKKMVLHADTMPSNRAASQWLLIPQHRWNGYRIDFAIYSDLPYPIFIECDGHDFHERTKEQAQRDRERDRTIQDAGIPILRFTGSEINRRAPYCAGQIIGLLLKRLQKEVA